jgi:hypothetical protein
MTRDFLTKRTDLHNNIAIALRSGNPHAYLNSVKLSKEDKRLIWAMVGIIVGDPQNKEYVDKILDKFREEYKTSPEEKQRKKEYKKKFVNSKTLSEALNEQKKIEDEKKAKRKLREEELKKEREKIATTTTTTTEEKKPNKKIGEIMDFLVTITPKTIDDANVKAFAQYFKENYTPEEWKELGIAKLDGIELYDFFLMLSGKTEFTEINRKYNTKLARKTKFDQNTIRQKARRKVINLRPSTAQQQAMQPKEKPKK